MTRRRWTFPSLRPTLADGLAVALAEQPPPPQPEPQPASTCASTAPSNATGRGSGCLVSDLHVVPLQLRQANALIESLHRHHPPARGHLFSLGAVDGDGRTRGACIVSRPVARGAQRFGVAEVTRLVSDGTRNVCSLLLGAARRVWFAMGGWRVQTYTLPAEGGASLRAAGWRLEGEAGGRQWVHTAGPRRGDDLGVKWRWAVERAEPPTPQIPDADGVDDPVLFEVGVSGV